MSSERNTKTNHKTGWHKQIKNPTYNYPKDEHKAFCRRCLDHNHYLCPVTGYNPSKLCDL